MKHRFLRKLIIAGITISTLGVMAPTGASAAWIKNYDGSWTYSEEYGYATGWRLINGTWYYFGSAGLMQTGWISYGGQWYYADLNGAMQTGLIQIEGKIHLFSQSGEMQKGTCVIDKKLYSFDNNGVYIGKDDLTPARAFDYYGNDTIPYAPSQMINDNASMSSEIPSDGLTHPKQYKVTFKDPDEDSEDEVIKTRTVDENIMMPLYKPSKSGYTFVEWNTDSDGNGTSYSDSDSIKIKKDITLYVQWKKATTTTTTT